MSFVSNLSITARCEMRPLCTGGIYYKDVYNVWMKLYLSAWSLNAFELPKVSSKISCKVQLTFIGLRKGIVISRLIHVLLILKERVNASKTFA